MNPHDDAKDDEQIAPILGAAASDAAPPDAEVLARLRTQSTEAFLASPQPTVKRPMLIRSTRWLAAAAAVIVIGVGLYFWLAPGPSSVAFGQVLENLEKADTLHVRVSRGDKELEFLYTSKPNRSRWDDLDGNYHIADGANFWIVNEEKNEARRADRRAGKTVDNFLDLLGVPGERSAVLAARPIERIQELRRDVLVYRMELPSNNGKIHLMARVTARTQKLISIQTIHDRAENEPLAKLTFIAYNEPIDAAKFVVADTLTEDGRIGKVTDAQGIVAVKPVLHDRWTPVREGLVLKPGDWLRTDARGANATALRLVKQTGVILGPKTLVELIGPKQVRLIEGEIEITPTAGAAIELLGPGPQKVAVNGKQFFRVQKQQLARVDNDPPWLAGFKGATKNESLGSLVALVDGRNVPLTVGYHKVSVDIRDQLARTVIEESFVNHTDAQLEGVFYFPLPQDASISGFGMWIGDNLVEADVVEKQRAREIYETILRERRDPGLLEWSGGNIFKARVFPIAPNSEKRIKITYTQVLSLKGSRYRYSYALQSELLQQHPLRKLDIDVKVNSAVPLKSVKSPTHPTRDERTSHSAHVEFTAQEYTPTRDFEVVVEVDGRQADVVMIPHRRGDDGYFMLQLTPPGAAGDWDRPILPSGEPVDLLILADTSASIDAAQRATQATFVGSLLSALTAKDTFNLAACDVTCDWTFTKAKSASAESVLAARDFLARRASLGWTDLDKSFAAALKQCGPKTHVVYVGDGIPTTGDADPVAFTKRLRLRYQGVGTFHAVALGSSYEPAVLKAIASLGGGSMRKITGEQGPATVARELLGEIAQPALRDIKVEFKGFKAARVYPESLANVPAGTQQILLGRYLPDGRAQVGEVIVTGTQGGKPVRFSTRAFFKDAEQGNSFIPRLWARMHLDSLLEQGSTETIKDEIIALSEEFQIITPYTSLLVLETDADRERFKVKRRFQMRDGERFFADGRDNAVFDLAQKQMKKAGAWRTAVRRSVLHELARLGREPRLFQPGRPYGLRGIIYDTNINSMMREDLGAAPLGLMDSLGEEEATDEFASLDHQKDKGKDHADKSAWAGDRLEERLNLDEPPSEKSQPAEPEDHAFGVMGDLLAQNQSVGGFAKFRDYFFMDSLDFRGSRSRGPHYGQWINTLFPPLRKTPGKLKEPKSTWPAAAHALVESLLRTKQLAKTAGAIEIVRQTDRFDTRWGDLAARTRRLDLVSARSWLTRLNEGDGQTIVSWCDGKECGVLSQAFQLGRVRAATALDVQPPPLELSDHSLTSLERAYPDYTPTLEPQGKDRTLLILKHASNPLQETRVLIDTERHVILSIEDRHKGKVTGVTQYGDFTEAAGVWWARRIETTNEEGKRQSLVTQTIKTRTLKEFEQQTKTELAGRAQVAFLNLPMPSVAEAKKALAAGKASFDDRLVLLLHFEHSQQWTKVLEHLREAEKLAAGKPGLRWLRSALLNESRRHDELRQRNQDDAARLAKDQSADAYFLASYLVSQSSGILQANEMLALLSAVQPRYDRQPPHLHAGKRWQQLRATYLSQAGRTDEALRLQKQLAAADLLIGPRDYSLHQQYAQGLAGTGDYAAAYAWLTRVLTKEAKWTYWEEEALRNTYTSLLQQQGRHADLLGYLADWLKQNPAGQTAYEQYLTALIKSDQIEKADALALDWLKAGQVPGELTPPVAARLHAAVNLMLGNGYQLYTNRIEERWLTPLAQAVLFFARHDTQASIAEQVVSHHQFTRTAEGRDVRKALAGILGAEIDKLPAEQIQRLADWIRSEDAEPAAWNKMIGQLRQRWMNELKDEVKHLLGQALVRVLSREATPNELLAFLRLQRQTGPEKYRAHYANELFDQLLGQPWSAAFEDEALTLLDKLSAAEEPGARRFTAVAALHRLTDKLAETRIAASMKTLEHPEKLTRVDLRKKQDEIRQAARAGLADRLRKQAEAGPKDLLPWLIAESLYLDVPLDRHLKQAAVDAWTFVGAAPQKNDVDEPTFEQTLDEILRQRYVITLTNLAARKGAEPALAERLLKYFEQGIVVAKDSDANRWRLAKYRLLVALDRGKELEQMLAQWTHEDDPDNRWRVALGYLLAEQGRLAEAIRTFEAIEAADALSPAAYRSLADWYLVQGQREASERSAAAVYATTPERQLSHMIALKLRPWQRSDGHLPTELDKEVLRMFAVLYDKSAAPHSYLSQLQQFYQASHDFRLLSGLPDAVIGHTAARVYPFVEGMRSVLDEVRDEATADEIVKRIAEVRPRAKTVVDQRALDLLEVLVERRAAEMQNQPGPHREKALAALQRAFKREWSAGEARLMADFLGSLAAPFREAPRAAPQALAEEQIRQLKALHAMTAAGSIDRLHIAYRHALALRSVKQSADAIDLLQAALDEFQAAHDGVLPVSANDALELLVTSLDDAGHFVRGEKVILAQLAHPVHAQQRRWLDHRLDGLYLRALQQGGDVSLGQGVALYRAMNVKIQKELAEPDPLHRYQLVELLCRLYRTAHEKKLPGVATDLKAFAFEIAPPLVKGLTHYHPSIVSTVAETVHDLLGPTGGITFLLNEMDSEPRWLRWNNQDGWSRHGNTLADWRIEAKDLGDVEGRLLKRVLAELRRDLETRRERTRALCHLHGDRGRFWQEKTDDFAKTAAAVLAERGESGAAMQYIADYFYWGLNRPNRAIDILFVAHGKKLLDDDGQAKLVDFLHRENRHGESIAVLQPLVERRPANLDYRVLLMHAYFRTARQTELLTLLKQTDAFFHEKDRWGEHALDRLAHSTLENELYEQAVTYFKELIPLHERTNANRGVGDGALARYYVGLANAYAGLRKTPEAVEAAGGAIIAWGPRHDSRAAALETLKQVLLRSPDLDAFVTHFDKEKQDSAVIRKALGQAYSEKEEYAKAIRQLERAAALQPNDAETYQLLIAAHDTVGDKAGAVRQLLQAVQLSRRDIKLYQELGKRHTAAGQANEAERAYTSIVEVLPTESESHALLAEIRAKQNRWAEAMYHWEQVARLRALEPTGLLKLAAAQIHEKQWDQARETLRKLDTRTWPTRFGDVPGQVRTLADQIAKKQKK